MTKTTMNKYHSNGKFLLSGEYLVLQGAKALALPLKLGQSLEVKTIDIQEGMIHWDSYTPRGFWFAAIFSKFGFTVHASDDMEKADNLCKIFQEIKLLNPNILQDKNDYFFTTRLEFDSQWGLGSSSTLISLLSQWANVNPYELLKRTMGGSGYDIACATASKPITYQIVNGEPVVEEINFKPAFSDKLYFVYQGHKQSSGKEVKSFKERAKNNDFTYEVSEISKISEELMIVTSFDEFCSLLTRHEAIMSRVLEQPPLKSQYPDFQGVIKSLGAWGGDFFLAATKLSEKEVKDYFGKKGLDVVIKYDNMVL
jgi:mevalonate kinase